MDDYIEKYDSLEKKLVFVFQVGHGGIGDCIKFFMQALYYSIKCDIKLHYFKANITIEKYLKLKHDKMYFVEGFDKLIRTDYSSLTNLEPHIYHYICPSDLYSQPLNITMGFDDLINIKDVFYLSDEVILNKNNLIPPNIDNYISIHLRMGDKHLEIDKACVPCYYDERRFDEEKLFRFIEDNNEKNIIFFCDNNSYKLKLKEKYDKIIITNSVIGHTSLSNTSEKQTLDAFTEFYIMTNSEKIYAASSSGFSRMASKFNNIPLCS